MENNAKLKKALIALLLVLAALGSFLFLADRAADPATHSSTSEAIDEKVETVLRLTATSTLASAGISAIPGDTASPIAAKLADFTEYFLTILCVLYSEKYLMTIIGAGTFKILIPCACALGIVSLFYNPKATRRLAAKFAVVGLAVYFVIPISIRVSDMIYSAYRASIENTISSAEQLTEKTSEISKTDEKEKGLIGSIMKKISETAGSLTDKAANILNGFVETLAVMIVTSCVIPVLVLFFFLWIIKLLSGIDISVPRHWGKSAGRD